MIQRRNTNFGSNERRIGVVQRAVAGPGRRRSELVGVDLAPMPRRVDPRRRFMPIALLGVLIASLGLAALRVELIRIRYDLAGAMKTEKQLLDQRRLLTADLRRLRDPARLGRLAAERGFVRPERVTELPAATVTAGQRP